MNFHLPLTAACRCLLRADQIGERNFRRPPPNNNLIHTTMHQCHKQQYFRFCAAYKWNFRLRMCIRSRPIHRLKYIHSPTSTFTGNSRWPPTNRKLLYLTFRQDRDAFPTALLMFRQSVRWNGQCRRHWYNRCNGVYMYSKTLMQETYGLSAAIKCFRYRQFSVVNTLNWNRRNLRCRPIAVEIAPL